ncbi:MAG: DUF1566 domain-containing protein [Nitrospiraceae bacterium]|nr:DUF1566 domain-containing protein [Nitrospiraceae bacterium]
MKSHNQSFAERCYLHTGQTTCHDASGRDIACQGSGQDAEFKRGLPWPVPRFEQKDETVLDRLTGLIWSLDANLTEFPVTWQEALDYISGMNKEKAFGCSDWRLPNRRELRSLVSHQTRKPALPEGHPFNNIFLGWYWTSTTAAINTAYAWYVHMEGARTFYGKKDQFFLLWPVRGKASGVLPATGQTQCYDSRGLVIPCEGSGQDAELRFGLPWPETRFDFMDDLVIDRLTSLCWSRNADITNGAVTWHDALAAVARLNQSAKEKGGWRLPNINELESLVDCSAHGPALPVGHPFESVRESYWSSTTSMFEPDWAWALYLTKGAVGVGQKRGPHFFVWPVCGPAKFNA